MCRPSSECFDGQRKHVADAAFGQNDARRVWIGLQLAPQAQDLHVDSAIEDIFVDPGRLQKVFAGERSLRSIRNAIRSAFAIGQRNRVPLKSMRRRMRGSSCQPPNRQRPFS